MHHASLLTIIIIMLFFLFHRTRFLTNSKQNSYTKNIIIIYHCSKQIATKINHITAKPWQIWSNEINDVVSNQNDWQHCTLSYVDCFALPYSRIWVLKIVIDFTIAALCCRSCSISALIRSRQAAELILFLTLQQSTIYTLYSYILFMQEDIVSNNSRETSFQH